MKRFNPLRGVASAPKKPDAKPKPIAPIAAVSCVTLTENVAKGGIELRFPEKPSAEVLEQLKAVGWRWSHFNNCWYAKNTPEHHAFAERFVETIGATPIEARETRAVPEPRVLHVDFQPAAEFNPPTTAWPAWKARFLRQ